MKKRIPFVYESSSLNLNIWEDEEEGHSATITDLFSKLRSRGHARGLMEKVLSYTDKAGLTVYLEVQQFGHPIGLDKASLEKFYESFGFTKLDHRWVRRAPSQDLHSI